MDIEQAEEILVLVGDKHRLLEIHETIEKAGYKVACARTMVEALEYLKVFSPAVVVIGTDLYKTDSQSIYNHLKDTIRQKGIQSLLLENTMFTDELVDRVKDALR